MDRKDALEEIRQQFGDLLEEEEHNPNNWLWAPTKARRESNPHEPLVNSPHKILAKNLHEAGGAIIEKPKNARGILAVLEIALRQTATSFPYFGVINVVVGEKIAEKKLEMQNKPRDFGRYLQDYARLIGKDMRLINGRPYYCCAMIILAMSPDGGIRYGQDFDKWVRRKYRVDVRQMAKNNGDEHLYETFKDILDLGKKVYQSQLKMSRVYEIQDISTDGRCLLPYERFVIQEDKY